VQDISVISYDVKDLLVFFDMLQAQSEKIQLKAKVLEVDIIQQRGLIEGYRKRIREMKTRYTEGVITKN
jgi:hypothetical protein